MYHVRVNTTSAALGVVLVVVLTLLVALLPRGTAQTLSTQATPSATEPGTTEEESTIDLNTKLAHRNLSAASEMIDAVTVEEATADFTVLGPDGTPIAGAAVTVSSGTVSVSGTTSDDGVVRLDLSDVLAVAPVGEDGLQRFNLVVEADGYGSLSIVNEYFGGPGGSHGATLTDQPRVEDRICIPRAASVFHRECPDYQGTGTPGPPQTGTGRSSTVSAGGGQFRVGVVLGGAALLAAAGLASWLLRRTARPLR
ncbi:MAG: hypothetical protein IT302_08625 [Dehalococcoidia bacterium]|nr:hypothetical protein [Dehalococcoidia bacterium]